MTEKCYRIIVKGKVQGVFFRKYTKIKADILGIKGFVRNEPDASVYIEACGEKTKLEEFVKWCSNGPKQALVEKVDVSEISVKKFSSFDIAYF
jgi:acylphosphatase